MGVADWSGRSIRLRTVKRTDRSALCGRRNSIELGEKDGNGDSEKREREARRSAVMRALQIGEKSVTRFARSNEDGQDWQRRPVRGPSSALPFDREDPTGAEERRRHCAQQ